MHYDNAPFRPLLLTFLVALAACGGPVAESPQAAQTAMATGEAKQAVQPWLPKPEVSATQLVAGATLSVRCSLGDGQASRPQVQLQPVVEPAMQVGAQSAQQVDFVAEHSGSFTVYCSAGSARGEGRTVQVAAGEPVSVAVLLQKTRVAAGETTTARCTGYDRAGNAVVPPNASVRLGKNEAAPQQAYALGVTLTGAHFTASTALNMEALDGRSLQLSSTQAGEVQVRCSVPQWGHLATSAPVTLMVQAASPIQLVAEVNEQAAQVHGSIAVHCLAYDEHHNPVGNTPTQILVRGRGETQVAADSFRTDVAGTYEVSCQSVQDARGFNANLRSAVLQVQVAAAAPVRWSVELDRQSCFAKNRRLPLTWKVFDDFNNRVDGVEVDLETHPPAKVESDGHGGFLFAEEGSYDIVLRPRGKNGARLAPWPEHIVVDSAPPRLEITSPARGAVVVSADKVQMLVGTVHDPVSTLKSLTINGVPQVLEPGSHSHAFAVAHESPWGLSVVHAVAEDACGNVAVLKQSYQRSAHFGPVVNGPDPKARVARGIRAAMAQPLWDDGDPTGGHDISNLLQSALQGGGLDERLPHELAAMTVWGTGKNQLDDVNQRCLGITRHHKENGVEVVRTGKLHTGGPTIEFLHVEEGGVHLALNFTDMRLPLAVNAYAAVPCGPATSSTVRATMVVPKLRIEVRGQVRMADGVVRVALCDTCVQAQFVGEQPDLIFDDPEAPGSAGLFVTEKIPKFLFHRSAKTLSRALQNRVRQDVVREAERLLGNLHIDHSLPLPMPMDGNASISSGVDNIILRGGEQGGGTSEVSLYTQAIAPLALQDPAFAMPVQLPPFRGAIRQETSDLLPLDLNSSDTFALSVRDEMLNQMLWSLWASGVFNGVDPRSFSEQAPVAGERNLLDAANVRLYFTTPPVIMPSDVPGEVRLGVGDVYAHVDVDTYAIFGTEAPANHKRLAATFYFSMIMRAKLGVDAQRRTLRVDPVGAPKVDLQVVDIASPVMHLTITNWLEKTINKTMPRILTQPLVAFPLPTLQIGKLPGIPNDAAWQLEDAEIERPAGAQEMVLRGRLAPLPRALAEALDKDGG